MEEMAAATWSSAGAGSEHGRSGIVVWAQGIVVWAQGIVVWAQGIVVWALALLLLTLVAPGDASAQARTVLNGGFELPVIATSWEPVPDTNVPGWTSPDGVIEIWQSGFNGVPAISGGQFAEANANSPSGFAQNVCLLQGESVPWSFWHRGRSGVDSMIVELGGVEVMRVGTDPSAWVQYTDTYIVPTSGPYEVRFTPINTGSVGNFVDDLYFQLVPHVDFGPDISSAETGAGGPLLYVSGTLTTAETVDLTVTGGTAVAGSDFAGITTVTIPAGIYDGTAATAITVDIGLIDDGVAEGPETVVFDLSNPSAGIRLAHADAAACGAAVKTTATFTIDDDEQADIQVTKTGATSVQNGTSELYEIVMTNAGPSLALGVPLTDTLPTGASFVSASRGATESGGVVTWPAVDTMTVGASITDSITISFGTNGTFDQVAAHEFPGNDPVPGNSRSALSITISGCGSPIVTVSTVAELRAAVADTCVTTINVNPGLYDLGTGGALSVDNDKIIQNAGGGEAIIDGAGNDRVFVIEETITATIDGLTIQNGSTGADGAGIRVRGSLTIRNSLVTGNAAGDDGGGLYMSTNSSLVMENVTVSGNTSADAGGGMHLRNGAQITHVTVANNNAGGSGEGVYVRSSGGATFTNTIIADNSTGTQLREGNSTVFASANLVEGCSGCPGSVLSGDPGLQPLALNGFETRSQALGTGSIAIDAASTGLPNDQHGSARPAGSGYDLGAYESPPPAGLSVTPDGLASPVQRSVGTEYSQVFTIGNSSGSAFDVDFLLSVTAGGGSPFVSLDSITGTGASGIADSVRVLGVPGGGSTDVTAWYTAISSTVGTVDDLVALGRLVSSPTNTDPGLAEVEYVCGSPTTTVTTMAALRAAVADACISTINITPGTYDLTSSGSGEMDIDRDLTIQSTGGGEVILDGANTSRIFDVQSGVNATLTGLTITRGYSPVDGGGINNQGTLVIENGLFFDNRSGDDGAALENAGGSVIIRNSTFSSNLAGDDGGAFQSDGGSVTLIHVTMVGNQAGMAGDETGGAFKLTGGATVSMNNSLLGDNIQGGGSPIDAAGGTVSSNGGNLVEGGCVGCLASDVTADGQVLPLANNGGDTRTHALASTSPAIDTGPDAGLSVDQRGYARPEGSGYDAGAFERSAAFDVQVRPDGLGSPLSQADGTEYQYPFWVVNTSTGAQDIDLLGSVAGLVGIPGSSFLTVDSIRGSGITGVADSARVLSVPSGDSAQVDVFYSISGGTLGQVDTLFVQGRLVAQPGVSDFGQIEIGYICGAGMTTVSTVAALRAAVANACVRTIGVTPGLYDLTSNGSGPLVVDRDLTVYNTGGGEAAIDAGSASRVWEINSGSVDFTGLTIQGGFNAGDGGGILNNGNLVITSGAILNNQTNDDGGGVYSASGSSLRLENVTVSGNSAGDRGAGVDVQGVGELIHVTVANNASLGGPAGGLNVRGGGVVTIRNTLIADNTQASGQQLTVAGSLTSNGANLIEGGCSSSCLASDLTGDPGLAPLAMNGGNSRTHAIPTTSIALDAASAADGLPSDQRGVARPIGPGYDIGAYEGMGPASIAVTPDGGTSNRLPGNTISYVENYTIENTGQSATSYALHARPAGAAVTVDSIRGTGLSYPTPVDSAYTGTVASSGTLAVDVYYTVAVVPEGTADQLILSAADQSVVNVADTGYVDVTVVRPSLDLTKTAGVSGTPGPGVEVTYDIQVQNTGSEDAVNVIVLDSIPVETDYKLASTTETLPSGVTAVVEFATTPGGWGYTPQASGCGATSGNDRCVRYVRWVLQAPLPATAPDNQGDFAFLVVIR